MSETIEIEVGSIYAQLHEQFSDNIDEYDDQLRQQMETIIHNLNQRIERAQEQQIDEAVPVDEAEELDLSEEEEAALMGNR